MKTLHIKLTLNYDDTQHTDDAVCEAVQNILEAHEHTVLQSEVVETCPKCDSDNLEIVENPVQRFFRCYVCNHEWTGHL